MQVLLPVTPPSAFQDQVLDDAHQEEPGSSNMAVKEEALLQCFDHLDLDQSGYIDIAEMRALAKQITPQANLADAIDMVKFGDKNSDQKLSWEEFRDVMLPLSEPMSDQEFALHVSVILGNRPYQAFNEPGYQHPQGSREWLNQAVVPQLREGLHALVDQLMREHLSLAAGTAWESGPRDGEGGREGEPYLPHDWKPFQSLRWLGEWLLDQLPPPTPSSPARPSALHPPSFSSLTRQEKIALAFGHLDRDFSGGLDTSELLSVAGKLHKDQDMAYAQELLQHMDLNQDGKVDLPEYCHFVTSLTEVLTDEEFDAAIHKVLGASHYSYCSTRPDKLTFLFHELDQERSGSLPYDTVVQLVHRMDTSITPWKIQSILDSMGIRHQGVGPADFVAALDKLLARCSPEDLDQAIVTMVEGRKLGGSVHAQDPLDEVEPLKLKQLLQQMEMPEHLLEIGTLEVVDSVDGVSGAAPLLLVDVRSAEEVAVSTLPGALHLPVTKDPLSPLGWALGDLEPLRRQLAETLTHGSRVPRIVAYCSIGGRSAPASILLGKTLGVAVRSLCGGIISYYNAGGRVRDPNTGTEVQAIHPGNPDLKQYVTRPSGFKFPG